METTLLDEKSFPVSTRILGSLSKAGPKVRELTVDSHSSSMITPQTRQSTSGWHVVPRSTKRKVGLLEASSSDQDSTRTNRGTGIASARAHIVQEWEGVVESVNGGNFMARLYEGNSDFPVQRAEIPIEEVAEQIALIKPGAVFTWFIGYRIHGSTRTRMSEITFRKLPVWTEEELKAAKIRGEKLGETAGWDSTDCAIA